MAFISLTILALTSYAQYPNVNNPGFENWTDLGTSSEEPTDWSSFKTASGTWSGSGAQQVINSTQIRPGSSGLKSARIWTRVISIPLIGDVIANGNLTTGRINMGATSPGSSSNYNYTQRNDAAFYESLGASPDSLVVWVKTSIANQNHQPRIHAIIHSNYDVRDPINSASTTYVRAEATLNFPSTNNIWLRKSIPFVYSNLSVSPTYILISFTTCKDPGVGSANDEMFIDDLTLVYNPTLTTGTISSAPVYVSASQGQNISVPFTLTGTMWPGNTVTAQLSDANGSFASPVTIGTLATTSSGVINAVIPAGTSTGSGYRIRVVSSNYAITAANNGVDLSITKIENTVTPASVQNICINSQGTLLTVNENFAGASREWKYATVSGGPYVSFIPAETSTTLTPYFQNAGNYYIVCQSNIGGVSTTSNEVEIQVYAQPQSGSLTPSLPQGHVCQGLNVSAVLSPGSGGTGLVSDIMEYRYDNGTWNPYTSGSPLSTTGYQFIEIRTYRTSSVSGCNNSTPVILLWNTSSIASSQALNITSSSADLLWSDANGSLWSLEYGLQGFTPGSGTVVSGITSPNYNLMGLAPSTPYSYYVTSNCSGIGGPYNFTTNLPGTNKILNVKLFLQGLYAGNGLMYEALVSGVPYFGAGIADKVTVELHNSAHPYDLVSSYNNLNLATNGMVSPVSVPANLSGYYYIVIKNRNSIETWSAYSVNFNIPGPITYDFSISTSQAYGNNQLLNGGTALIYSGEAIQDNLIDFSDVSDVFNANIVSLVGYFSQDINGDGLVDFSDVALTYNNSLSTIQVAKP